jgi:hypothetical protein
VIFYGNSIFEKSSKNKTGPDAVRACCSGTFTPFVNWIFTAKIGD